MQNSVSQIYDTPTNSFSGLALSPIHNAHHVPGQLFLLPCLTCGGSGSVADYQDYGMTTVFAGSHPCPDCGGLE